jgi:hypothetical protein
MTSGNLKKIISKLKNDSALLQQVLNAGENSEILSSLGTFERQAVLETFSSSSPNSKIGPLDTWA